MFMTETASLADVVLPAANAYEKSGTFTNTCGDLQLEKKAGEVSGSKSDFEMIVRIALVCCSLFATLRYSSAADRARARTVRADPNMGPSVTRKWICSRLVLHRRRRETATGVSSTDSVERVGLQSR